jgi:hypothetical protein
MILALISSSDSSSWGWPIAASVGGVVVFVGLLLEKIAGWKNEKFSPPFFKPHKWLGECGWWILMFGILAEIIVGFALAAKDEIEERNTASQMAQTRTNVAKLDPLNQPIGLLTARVSLFENGTNRSHLDFSSPLGGKFLVRLKLRSSKHSISGWPFELVCTSGESTLGTTNSPVPGTNFPGNVLFLPDGLFWDLEFGASSMASVVDIIPLNATVQDANDLDSVEFDALFLRPETEIRWGKIILTINSTKKEFEIPPQRVQKVEEIPLTKEEKDGGYLIRFISPKIDKTVTLVSWAFKE